MKEDIDPKKTHGIYTLSQKFIADIVKRYCFIETSDIIRFLDIICVNEPDSCDYVYIRGKLGRCLKAYDDKSDDFIPLRELACMLDFLIWKDFKCLI